jgi:hypothetical protein
MQANPKLRKYLALATVVLLLLIVVRLVYNTVDLALALDDARHENKYLEKTIADMNSIMDPVVVGLPADRVKAVAKELEKEDIAVDYEPGKISIGATTFIVSDGVITSVDTQQP